jgi:hypothetical protein
MNTLRTIYATDEDIALRAAADFTILCPKDQKLAAGSDGSFSATNPWTMTSSTVDFSAYGLTPGQLIQLVKPVMAYKPPGEAFVIVSFAPGAVTLRRKGQLSSVGQPPGPQAGLASIEFLITTLGPQIEAASYDLNRRYGIDDLVVGRQSSELYDPREVKDATVLTVLYRQYQSMSREAGEHRDNFAAKAQAFKDELDDVLARVVVHWLPVNLGGTKQSDTLRFSTRVAR